MSHRRGERLWQNPICFQEKSPRKSRRRENIPQYIKIVYGKATANIIFNGEKLKTNPFKLGIPLSFTHFQYGAQINSLNNKAIEGN